MVENKRWKHFFLTLVDDIKRFQVSRHFFGTNTVENLLNRTHARFFRFIFILRNFEYKFIFFNEQHRFDSSKQMKVNTNVQGKLTFTQIFHKIIKCRYLLLLLINIAWTLLFFFIGILILFRFRNFFTSWRMFKNIKLATCCNQFIKKSDFFFLSSRELCFMWSYVWLPINIRFCVYFPIYCNFFFLF